MTIRGRRGPGDLVDPKIFDPSTTWRWLRAGVAAASPFPHLVEDGWFNPDLLELAGEEFATLGARMDRSGPAATSRSTGRRPSRALGPGLGAVLPAGQRRLVRRFPVDGDGRAPPDRRRHLHGGGLHESRTGGRFGIHRDFDRHLHNGLQNELSMMTYLNKDWDPGWGGALELWDKQQKRSPAPHRARVQPVGGAVPRAGPASTAIPIAAHHAGGHHTPLAVLVLLQHRARPIRRGRAAHRSRPSS